MFVWQRFTNTLRYTDGYWSYTYSQCGLQQRLNWQSFLWELNPALLNGPPGPSVCDLA